MSKTVREIMTGGAECIGEDERLSTAAEKMAKLNVGALPICGNDDRLKGMITDRDIVVKAISKGKDPRETRAKELAQGKPVTIGADASVEETLATMREHKIRRLPVIDHRQLVGIVSQADIAHALGHEQTGELVETISS